MEKITGICHRLQLSRLNILSKAWLKEALIAPLFMLSSHAYTLPLESFVSRSHFWPKIAEDFPVNHHPHTCRFAGIILLISGYTLRPSLFFRLFPAWRKVWRVFHLLCPINLPTSMRLSRFMLLICQQGETLLWPLMVSSASSLNGLLLSGMLYLMLRTLVLSGVLPIL